MENLQNDIVKQQQENITFLFERQENILIVNAKSNKTLYCAKFQLTPNITADSLKESLENNNFKIIQKNSEVMKIVICGIIHLSFTSKDKLKIEELQSSIEVLNQKLEAQIEKNNKLSQNVVNLEKRIRILEEKLSEALSNIEQFQDQVKSNIQQRSQNIQSLNETVEEHKARQLQKDNTFKQKIDQHSAELTRRTQLHEELKNELTNQINQNKGATQICKKKIDQHSAELTRRTQLHEELKNELTNKINKNKGLMQTADQDQVKKITTSTTQLTQLRTQFNQLITQTIPILMPYKPQFLKQSKVVNMHEEKLRISNFFENKTIKNVKLLYRASDKQFSIAKFHQKCNGKENTLTLILTQFNAKIGGFTPLKWASTQNYEYVADNSKESFIFSLTNNDKFTLQQPEYAIRNNSSCGPIFGNGQDLILYDKSNLNNSSFANICSSYKNEKYKYYDSASYQRFHGGATGNLNFKTLEWEVWAVEWA